SGMSFFLPRIVGYSRAADLIFTSRNVDGEDAYRIGLLDRLVPHDSLIPEAVALAKQIASWPPMAMQSSKRVLQHNLGVSLEEALRYETAGLGFARRAPHDVREARLSFVEKRPPVFTGE
ncbi:MAG: enoyl-CoA hydratase/isomerase family protein, partial [Acidimicrobiia bacterium]